MKQRGEDHVHLDVTHKDPEETKKHFPNIYKKATFAGNCENYDDKTHNNRREIYHADGSPPVSAFASAFSNNTSAYR